MFKSGDRVRLKKDEIYMSQKLPGGMTGVVAGLKMIGPIKVTLVETERFGTLEVPDVEEYFELAGPPGIPVPDPLRAWYSETEKFLSKS